MAASDDVAVVVDVGGTWLRASLADRQGNVLWRHREPTHFEGDSQGLVGRMEACLHQAMAVAGARPVAGIGLSLAGPVDPVSGVLYNPPHLPELDRVSLKSLWGEKLGVPVAAGNDANLGALAECTYGVGKDARTLVYITISTGIGGGVIHEGNIFVGAHGMAAELGHICVALDGPPCTCGASGCMESLASGWGIAQQARCALKTGQSSLMNEMAEDGIDRVEAPLVFQAAAQGDPLARDIVAQAGNALGSGLVTITNAFDPELIVVGGSVSQQWPVLWPIIESFMAGRTMRSMRNLTRVVRSNLGDDIGMLGAASLVWRTVEGQDFL